MEYEYRFVERRSKQFVLRRERGSNGPWEVFDRLTGKWAPAPTGL